MTTPADFKLDRRDGKAVLAPIGDWTARGLGRTAQRLAVAVRDVSPKAVDLSGLGLFDTAGAYELARVAKVRPDIPGLDVRPDVVRLIELVGEAKAPERA